MNRLSLITVLVLSISCICTGCEKNETDASNVDMQTIIHAERYGQLDNNTPLTQVRITGDELHVTITASGCNGSRWEATLIDSGKQAYSNPPQRYAKIEFVNNEDCLAVISRIFVFNLKPLRVKESRKVYINLEGWSQSLLYTY